MTGDLARRSHELFVRAIDISDGERAGFIASACAGDDKLRREVEKLVRAIEDSATFLEVPALSGGARVPSVEPVRRETVGGYRIVRTIGVGGMATVYEAVQSTPHRRVALKVMRHGLARASAIARFRFETEVLAKMHHPGIAQIYEAGTHDEHDGVCTPYFAMELIEDARPLTDHARAADMPIRGRLELFASVCDAVHHGHQLGIIHRDLKPGNILVGRDGRTKVIDFGVARSTDPGHTRITYQADIGQLLGTLGYMSPEQCTGDAGSLDTRTDVYSLGVILYELVCGRLPHDVADKPITEALRIVQRDDPRRPSAINPALRGDLEAIILKAIEKDRDRRYPTASEFGADIRRYLDDAPVTARPATTLYQLRKFAARNRALVAGVGAVFLTLVAGIATTARMAYVANQARAAAEARQRETEQVAAFQSAQLSDIDVNAMGDRLRDDLRTRAHAPAPEFDASLASINFTDVARSSLDQTIFDPTAAAIHEQFDGQPEVQALLLSSLARTASSLGLVTRATEAQQAVVQIRRTDRGNDAPETLDAIDALGSMLAKQGKRPEAEACFREAIEGRRRIQGNDAAETLESMNSLCSLLQDLGRYDEAEPMLREVLEARRRVLGPEAPGTIKSMHNMANLVRGQGRLAEAEAQYRAVLEMARRVLPPDDAETLRIIGNFASMLQVRGALDEAETLMREALELRRRTLGNDHPDTLFSVAAVASVLKDKGELAEAESLYREALEGRRRVLGEDHASTLHTIGSLGTTLQQEGKLDEAVPYYEAALAGRRRVLGDDHPNTLQAIYNMSGLLYNMHRYEEAEVLAREAIDRARRTMPEGHWYNGLFLGHLGDILIATDRYPEAEGPLLEAHAIFQTTFGPGNDRTIGAARALAAYYEAWSSRDPDHPHDADAKKWRDVADHPPAEAATHTD